MQIEVLKSLFRVKISSSTSFSVYFKVEMASVNGFLVFLAIFFTLGIGIGMCDASAASVDGKLLSPHMTDYTLLEKYSDDASISNISQHRPLPLEFQPLRNDDGYFHRKGVHRRSARTSLCEMGCDCPTDVYNKFKKVHCDFKKQKLPATFGDRIEVPPMTTSLVISLATRTNLLLEEGLFDNNKVNRLLIEGTPGGLEHVEVSTNTFKGNSKAPFPDIEFSNCHTVVLRAKAFRDEFKLKIQNSNEVIIFPNTFYNTSFEGRFHNIEDLRMQEYSFNSSKATIEIAHSNLEDLYRFDSSLREIRFFNCSIGTINTETFDVLLINSIVFEQCKINVFKTKSITEKLLSSYLAISEGIIGTIENEAISGSGIAELLLAKNEIDTIQESAIRVTAVNATITENTIKHLGDKWLRVAQWSNITISKNKFGDFGVMVLEESKTQNNCRIESNFITNPKPGSLNIKNRFCIIRETAFYQPCTCNMTWLELLSTRDLRSESYCTIDDRIKHCFNTTIVNVLKYWHVICDENTAEVNCKDLVKLTKIKGEFLKPEELEKKSKHMKLIYILAGVGILIVLIVIAFILAHKLIKRKAATMPISDVAAQNANTTSLKDLRTFSNDDRKIINKTMETLKQKYPAEVSEQVCDKTQILLRGNITEMERVKTIGDIVQILGECQNPGEDFVAFTDILYRHLAPTSGPPPDPVYAEPMPPDNDVANGNANIGDGQTNIDHIYAEPLSVNQPLLTNEYASPADKNEMMELYSEPITNASDRKIIPPYAVIGPREPHPQGALPQLPSTSKNLPDVLNQSKPMTNVQKMAQNFANNPNFHITYSPNTNRRIPKYTIPNKTKTSEKPGGSTPKPGGGGSGSSGSSDNRSNHSGGSDITVKIDDIIEYADA